ncbi:hypothetical protein ACR77J_07540 [Tissierella praeacuta]|uniref:hypothetical protein n=1 Tax=Tissierella praeacuta TaxID=43131 RepID=UPI003DA511D8
MTTKRIEVEIPKFLEGVLIKDLQENEVICKECEGTGLAIRDNIYGLKGEQGFNYKRQTISFCQHCYNGIREKCRFCGELLPRGYMKCDCEGYKKHEEEKYIKAEQERFEKAKKISYEDYIKQFPDYMIYDVNSGRYYSDFEDLEEQCKWDEAPLPKYVYGTHKMSICLDVDSIIESACDELHEGAMYDLNGEDELSSAIDDFNLKNERNTATYYPDYSLAILL